MDVIDLCNSQGLADLSKRRHTSMVWLPPFRMPPHAGAGVPRIVDPSQMVKMKKKGVLKAIWRVFGDLGRRRAAAPKSTGVI